MFKRFLLTVALLTPFIVNAQLRTFTFTINSKDYKVTEEQMNNFFGATFQDMINNQVATNKAFDLWKGTFERMKNNAESGRYSWKTYGTILADGQYTYNGEIAMFDLGLEDNGKPAKGNPNKPNNIAMRTVKLISYIEYYVTNTATEYRVNR